MEKQLKLKKNVSREMQSALFDPQTAGGLLISIEEEKAEDLLREVKAARVIGRVEKFNEKLN